MKSNYCCLALYYLKKAKRKILRQAEPPIVLDEAYMAIDSKHNKTFAEMWKEANKS